MLPKARETDLVIETFEREVLVYDTRNNRAHSLSALAAQVWRACDGTRSPQEVASSLGLSQDEVNDGLARLDEANLFESRIFEPSRRKFLRKVATAGGLLVIASITAPRAANALSPGGFNPNVGRGRHRHHRRGHR